MAFDILQVDDELVVDKPYRERRRILEELDLTGPHWCTPEIHIGEGAALFAAKLGRSFTTTTRTS